MCSVCGAKIDWPKTCPNCNASVEDDAEFCDECGQNLNSSKNDLTPVIEENLGNAASATLTIVDKIILFFKQLFGGNS